MGDARSISGDNRIRKLKPHRPLCRLLNAERPDREGPRPRPWVSPSREGILPPLHGWRRFLLHQGRPGERGQALGVPGYVDPGLGGSWVERRPVSLAPQDGKGRVGAERMSAVRGIMLNLDMEKVGGLVRSLPFSQAEVTYFCPRR